MTKKSTPENWNKYYSFPFFDYLFRILSNYHFNYFYAPLINFLDVKSTLELGGGVGHLTMAIKKIKKSKASILDHSNNAMLKHKKEYGNETEYYLGNVFDLKFEKKYDLVFSDGLVEHFKEPEQSNLIKKHCELASKFVIIAAPKPTIVSTIFSAIVCYEKGMYPDKIKKHLNINGFDVIKVIENSRYFLICARKQGKT